MKATIELNGMIHEIKEYEGSPQSIIFEFCREQNLECLVNMGKQFGEDVSELEKFVNKYNDGVLTFEDVANLNIELSIGTIKCVNAKK